jgi:hypothetical protein
MFSVSVLFMVFFIETITILLTMKTKSRTVCIWKLIHKMLLSAHRQDIIYVNITFVLLTSSFFIFLAVRCSSLYHFSSSAHMQQPGYFGSSANSEGIQIPPLPTLPLPTSLPPPSLPPLPPPLTKFLLLNEPKVNIRDPGQ